VQQELRRLAHRAHEEEQAHGGERIDIPAQEMEAFAGKRRRLGENRVEIDCAGEIENRENAQRKAEVADAIDDESLDRGGIGFRAVIPKVARDCPPSPASAWRR
jgi:hypothetical protein